MTGLDDIIRLDDLLSDLFEFVVLIIFASPFIAGIYALYKVIEERAKKPKSIIERRVGAGGFSDVKAAESFFDSRKEEKPKPKDPNEGYVITEYSGLGPSERMGSMGVRERKDDFGNWVTVN